MKIPIQHSGQERLIELVGGPYDGHRCDDTIANRVEWSGQYCEPSPVLLRSETYPSPALVAILRYIKPTREEV